MPTPDLLQRPADVTSEWLSRVLARAGALRDGARVTGFDAVPVGTGQMADTVRFALTYDRPGGGPDAVVGKFASADEQSRATGLALRAYEIEVRFYREVAPRVAARVPAMVLAEVDPSTGWFTLLMEDIWGARQGDQIEACSPEVATAVLEEMAGLHAPCWEAPDLASLEWLNRNTAQTDQLLSMLVASLLPGFLERYAEALAPEHRRVCEVFANNITAWVRGRHGPPTAVHGDFRLDNLLFQPGEPRPVVVDWQTLAWGTCAADVAYFVGGCLTVEDRRAYEDDLLVRYHGALSRRGVAGFSLGDLRASYWHETFAGVLMAIVASMVVLRTERGDLMFLTSTARHAQHVLDAGALDLLAGTGAGSG